MRVPVCRSVMASMVVLALSALSLLGLSACGNGTIYQSFTPSRIVVFGDGLSDTGFAGYRYTMNGASSPSNWVENLALSESLSASSVAPAAPVGSAWNYARGNARVSNPIGAASVATLSLSQQMDLFASQQASFQFSDLVVIQGGMSDLVAEIQAVASGQQSQATALSRLAQAGNDLANLVRRAVTMGAQHVVLINAYDLSKTPYASMSGQSSWMGGGSNGAVRVFNDAIKQNLGNLASTYLGDQVYLIDLEAYVNQVVANPGAYSLSNVTDMLCTSADTTTLYPGPIGVGHGQISSSLCNTTTIVSGANPSAYLFADPLHFTPAFQATWGSYALSSVNQRW
jgi:outer membrane lipase/esterase